MGFTKALEGRRTHHTTCKLASLASLGFVVGLAAAVPVAVRFPDRTTDALLADIDPGFPDLVLSQVIYQAGGAVEVGVALDLPDENGDPTCAFGLVEGSRYPAIDWREGPHCDHVEPNLSTWGLYGPVKCFGCDWSEGFPNQVLYRSRITAYYLRHRPDMASEWTYGWVAIQAITIENLTCDPQCAGVESSFANLNILAAGFETDPGVLVPIGTGLCAADLNFDGVLDLADVQMFVENFVDGYNIADRNADGVYDLVDLQTFVGAFVGGCP